MQGQRFSRRTPLEAFAPKAHGQETDMHLLRVPLVLALAAAAPAPVRPTGNVPSTRFPGGEVRGQLRDVD
jgi:hypothetical protein